MRIGPFYFREPPGVFHGTKYTDTPEMTAAERATRNRRDATRRRSHTIIHSVGASLAGVVILAGALSFVVLIASTHGNNRVFAVAAVASVGGILIGRLYQRDNPNPNPAKGFIVLAILVAVSSGATVMGLIAWRDASTSAVARGPTLAANEVKSCLNQIGDVTYSDPGTSDPAFGGASHPSPHAALLLVPFENVYLSVYRSPTQAQRVIDVSPATPGDPYQRIGNVVWWAHYDSLRGLTVRVRKCLSHGAFSPSP